MSRKGKGAPKAEGIKRIAADKFDEVAPSIVNEYKEKIDELDDKDVQGEVVNMGNQIMNELQSQLPDYKIVTHAMCFRKGPASLYDAWATHWEVDKDSMCVFKDESAKHHIMVYGLFYPLKVPDQ